MLATEEESPLSVIQMQHGILKSLQYIRNQIDSLQQLLGTKLSPASSCGEILRYHKDQGIDLINGTYWIDPNRGYKGDAFQVECLFNSDKCINSMEVVYDVEKFIIVQPLLALSQYNFLYWHSLRLEQSFDIPCRGGKFDGLDGEKLEFDTFGGGNKIDVLKLRNKCMENVS